MVRKEQIQIVFGDCSVRLLPPQQPVVHDTRRVSVASTVRDNVSGLEKLYGVRICLDNTHNIQASLKDSNKTAIIFRHWRVVH